MTDQAVILIHVGQSGPVRPLPNSQQALRLARAKGQPVIIRPGLINLVDTRGSSQGEWSGKTGEAELLVLRLTVADEDTRL